MAGKRSNRAAAGPRRGEGRPKNRPLLRGRWLGVLLGLGLLSAGIYGVNRAVKPAIPKISLQGLEPLVAAQVGRARAEVQRSSQSGPAWAELAMVLEAHELDSEASICFARAARLQPREPRWPYLHGLLLRTHEPARALALLQEAAELAGTQTDGPLLHLAEMLFEAGRFAEAEVAFNRLLSAAPNHPLVRLGLAQLALARNQIPAARSCLQPALADPAVAQRAQQLLASLERRSGNKEAADLAARRARTLPPDPPWPDPWLDQVAACRIGRKAWSDRGLQLLTSGRRAEAEAVIDRLTTEYPRAPEGWLLKARLHLDRNDCAGAEKLLRQHLALDPDSVNGHAQLGMTMLCLERPADAAAALNKALLLKPDLAEAHFNLGLAQLRLQRTEEAMHSFRHAIRYSPNFVEPYLPLADLLLQTGEKAEAVTLLQRAMVLRPDDERANALLQRAGR